MQAITTTSGLRVGDVIEVEAWGRGPWQMTVSAVYTDHSKAAHNGRTVTAHIRPGGYSVTFDDMHLAEGIVTARWT